MKEHKSIKFSSAILNLLSLLLIFSSVNAQEYDDMYFNKSDRKKIKTENKQVAAQEIKTSDEINYSQATKSTELYSAKNVNPEYIARYKATQSNEVSEVKSEKDYSSGDYFIEDYDSENIEIGTHANDIDYAALNKRDQMSYSNYNRNFSNRYWSRPSWGFYPSMSMGYGFGNPYFYDPFMYDPFMMGGFGYGPMMSMGMGYGFGTGFYPSMSYSLSMSWGTGFNPWGGWGAYPYNPYRMGGFYDPWRWGSGFACATCSPYFGAGYGGFYGFSRPYYVVNSFNNYDNGRNIQYKQRRTSRSATSNQITRRVNEGQRVSSADSRIRVPNRSTSPATSNGRISRDYSKSQNEYYRSTRNSSASQRISTSRANRSSFTRSSSSSRYNTSSISSNRPSRVNNSSSGFNRSSSGSSYSNYNRSGGSSSYSTPSRSGSSSFNSSGYSGGSRSSSFSSGSRSSSSSGSSGTRSSGGSRSGGRR